MVVQWRPYTGEIAGSRAKMSSASDLTRLALRVERSGEQQTKSSLDLEDRSRLPVCALLGRALLGPQRLEQGGGRRLGSSGQSRLCPAPYRGKALQITGEVKEGSRKPNFIIHLGTLLPSAAAIAPIGHYASSPGPRPLCYCTGFQRNPHRPVGRGARCTFGHCPFVRFTLQFASTRASCCGTQHVLYLIALHLGPIGVPLFSVVE
jgi:hypothetical protein